MNAVTIMEDVNSYASISQEDTTAPACKATPYRVMTHLVKVYIQLRIHINVKMSKRVGMRTRTREMAMEILGQEGGVKWGCLIFLMVYLAVFRIIQVFRVECQYF